MLVWQVHCSKAVEVKRGYRQGAIPCAASSDRNRLVLSVERQSPSSSGKYTEHPYQTRGPELPQVPRQAIAETRTISKLLVQYYVCTDNRLLVPANKRSRTTTSTSTSYRRTPLSQVVSTILRLTDNRLTQTQTLIRQEQVVSTILRLYRQSPSSSGKYTEHPYQTRGPELPQVPRQAIAGTRTISKLLVQYYVCTDNRLLVPASTQNFLIRQEVQNYHKYIDKLSQEHALSAIHRTSLSDKRSRTTTSTSTSYRRNTHYQQVVSTILRLHRQSPSSSGKYTELPYQTRGPELPQVHRQAIAGTRTISKQSPPSSGKYTEHPYQTRGPELPQVPRQAIAGTRTISKLLVQYYVCTDNRLLVPASTQNFLIRQEVQNYHKYLDKLSQEHALSAIHRTSLSDKRSRTTTSTSTSYRRNTHYQQVVSTILRLHRQSPSSSGKYTELPYQTRGPELPQQVVSTILRLHRQSPSSSGKYTELPYQKSGPELPQVPRQAIAGTRTNSKLIVQYYVCTDNRLLVPASTQNFRIRQEQVVSTILRLYRQSPSSSGKYTELPYQTRGPELPQQVVSTILRLYRQSPSSSGKYTEHPYQTRASFYGRLANTRHNWFTTKVQQGINTAWSFFTGAAVTKSDLRVADDHLDRCRVDCRLVMRRDEQSLMTSSRADGKVYLPGFTCDCGIVSTVHQHELC
ncbi:hypothetical protein J6590_016445 [Homalodisca vitripennis]|nr:hypothetical protein J6590_016445 [Homalodisca vitripennis]